MTEENKKHFHLGLLTALAVMRRKHDCSRSAMSIIYAIGGSEYLHEIAEDEEDKATLKWIESLFC